MAQNDQQDFRIAPPHPSCLPEAELLKQCELSQTRRGGPGGQHRNKTSTAIVIEHLPTGIIAEASERRSQADNRRVAIRRLREELAILVRTDLEAEVRHLTISEDDEHEPIDWSEMSASIRKLHGGGSLRFSENNPDRPAVLAILLDDLSQVQGAIQSTAQLWNTSSSQIIKLLKQLPAAIKYVNQLRADANIGPLK